MKYMILNCCPRSQLLIALFIICGTFLFTNNSFSQSGTITGSGTVSYNQDGSVTVDGTKVFTSHISDTNESVDNMLQLDAVSLFKLSADLSGGIKSQVKKYGTVILSVYSYDPQVTGKKGQLLYKVKTTTTSTTAYIGTPETVPIPVGPGNVKSDQIKYLLKGASTWIIDRTQCPSTVPLDLFTTTMAYINGQTNPILQTDLNNCLKGNNYKLLQPVILEVSVTDAILLSDGLKYPGMADEFNLSDYFDPNRALSVNVKINNVQVQTYKAGNKNPSPLNLKMGDVVTYEVNYKGHKAPQIEGMPGVWIARFAGDLMYYCSPSVTPGEFSPWIGFDSRVHNLQLRNYNGTPSFKMRELDWIHSENTWTWSYAAQREMDANKSKYLQPHTWIKYKTLKSGIKQRNNQREGLNIQYLEYWQGGENSDFGTYSGSAKYMMGFDDDELLYLNSQYHDAKQHPPLSGGGIVKLDSIISRGMPEGYDQIYDKQTGYPVQGFPLNIMISAYRKNREHVLNHNSDYNKKYNGYEIQDIGTDEQHPDGTGSGNVKAPGFVYIKAGGQVVTIKMNVTTPLSVDHGFYGSVEGNRWPAYQEKNIPYTLSGLNGLNTDELNKYSMVYQGSDALGNLYSQEKYLKDLSATEKAQVASSGKWTVNFDNTYPTYSCITVYYQVSSTSDKVIIAGKELKPIFLLFLGEKSLEGKGLGAKIWLNDFRETRTTEYNVPRQFGKKTKYMKPDVRTYTFRAGTTTTFQTWDGDPHLFYDPGVEWFLSSRTLAKRVPDNYLDGTAPGVTTPYLKYYVNGVEQTTGRSGKDLTYTWNTPGVYTLKVEYRTPGSLTTYQHKVNVIDYPTSPDTKGSISARELTGKEISWLNLSDPSKYRLFEVKDIYSQYMYKDGPRANTPYVNRWAEHNDYASQYEWNRSSPPEVDNFIRNYNNLDWFWHNWALHYSSNWRDNLPDGLPPYVPNNLVTRVVSTELDHFSGALSSLFSTVTQARWQYTVPLVSFTDFQGDRMRTNPSCLYDINFIFNNDYGAFSGNVTEPDDPSKIQAPDITDDQKDKQEFYYDLKSRRITVIDVSGSPPINVLVRNVYGGKDTFIAQTTYTPGQLRSTASEDITVNKIIRVFPTPVRAGEKLNISIEDVKEQFVQISLYSNMGRLILTQKKSVLADGGSFVWETTNLSTGIYYVVFSFEDSQITKKLVVLQ